MMERFVHILLRSFEREQWVVSLGERASSGLEIDGAAQHLLLFGRICVVDEPRVIIVVLSWFHIWVLDEPPEVLGSVLLCILREKSFFWLNVVADWMLLANSFCSCISVRIGEKVFADQPLDMSGVPRNMLVPDHMVWPAHPIFREATIVTVHLLIFVDRRDKF